MTLDQLRIKIERDPYDMPLVEAYELWSHDPIVGKRLHKKDQNWRTASGDAIGRFGQFVRNVLKN